MLTIKLPASRSKKRQSGLSLIESLVALVVLALGVMGLAGVQTRLLVETRTANSRAIAVQLIDDLTNRMALNRYAAMGKPQLDPGNPQFSNSRYALAWSNTTGMTPPTPATCLGAICTPEQLAAVDLFDWRTNVNRAFPGAQATVIQLSPTTSDPRQLAVGIAWSSNEKAIQNAADNTVYNTPFNLTAANSAVTCPVPVIPGQPAFICHVVYVQP